ncbi:MAG: exo-alpha-sialidase [Clostridia bacterium]|nr:exo-alpha-sialidase [Clostridia bacterium]
MLITEKQELKKYYSNHMVWVGIPSLERTKGGRIFITAYSGGTDENFGNFCFLLKSDNETDFGEPVAVTFLPGENRCYDPTLWIDPLDRLWFVWNTQPDEEVWAAVCDDPDADTLKFSEPFYIGRGIMLNKPTVLTSGEWIFPIAVWEHTLMESFRNLPLLTDDKPAAYVYKTSDNGQTFVRLGGAVVPNRCFDEHMVLEQKNGILRMLIRTYYGIGQSFSYDRGKSWSKGEDSKLGGPCSRFFFRRLKSGRVLLINHYKFSGRNNLTALLSDDDGKTFTHTLLLDERGGVSYPDAVEEKGGFIYITYDRERGGFCDSLERVYQDARELLIAKITEDDIIAGELKSEHSYLKRVAFKLHSGNLTDPDPYIKKQVPANELAERLINENEPDIIARVFELHTQNCVNVTNRKAKNLDALIKAFKETDCTDKDLLTQIIIAVRQGERQDCPTSPIIEKIKTQIEVDLTEEFSLSDLAEKVNISRYYLAHLFKTQTGTTVIEYRNELKLTKAKLMLINTEDSVGDIALKCGFCSAAYFTEVFSKSEKIPPTEYRKYHKHD